MIWLFKIGVAINALAVLIAFFDLVSDAILRPRLPANGLLFLVTLMLGAWVAVAIYLKTTGQLNLATALLWIPGAPLALMGIFFLVMIIVMTTSKTSWH